jgi:protein-tyrosine phosphatase
MLPASRKIPLEGAWNVRDLGGLPTLSGGSTCRNRYLRGDSLANLSEADVRLLLERGVRAVIDLREPGEAAAQPSRLLDRPGVRVHPVPLFGDLNPIGSALPTQLGDLYLLCLRHGGPALRRTFELLAGPAPRLEDGPAAAGLEDEQGAVLFHCAVGKDRTGVVAALLLDLVGVTRKAIVEDYLDSGVNLKQLVDKWIAQYESDPDTGYHPDLLHCLPQNIERLLDALAETYGGAAAYLRGAGVSDAALERIRRRLSDPACR